MQHSLKIAKWHSLAYICKTKLFNPWTPKISSAILLIVCCTVLVMLVWRIWYWINFDPQLYFSLFAWLACSTLYWYWKKKFCLGHSWELKIKLMYDAYNKRLLVQLSEEIVTKRNTKYSLRGSNKIVVPRF